jgi:general stress protein 26
MNPIVLDLISTDKVGVISVALEDGTIHSATVHYSHNENPLKIYIQTSNTTLKVKPFLNGQIGKGAFVIGFSEDEWLTLQMHGEIRAISDQDQLEEIYKIHYKKHPDAEQYKGPNTVFLEFSPIWWRYTDFNTDPETIINS